jgi:hypothetical protein
MQSPLSILTLNSTTLFLYHAICIFASSLCCLLCDKMMIPFLWALIHKANANKIHANSTARLLKNLMLKPVALGYLSTVLRPHCQVDKKSVRLSYHQPNTLPRSGRGKGGCPQKRGGGGSPVQTTAPNHFVYAYVGLDAMSNPRKRICVDTMIE